jgi:hypothetical protein
MPYIKTIPSDRKAEPGSYDIKYEPGKNIGNRPARIIHVDAEGTKVFADEANTLTAMHEDIVRFTPKSKEKG